MPDIYKQTSIEDVILSIFAIIVLIVIVGCLYSFFRAVFLFIFAGSKEENKKKGRNSIRFMSVGLLLTIGLLFAFPYVLKPMNIDITNNYTPKQVFVRAGELLQKLVGLKDIVQKSQEDNQFRGNLFFKTSPGTVTPSNEPKGAYDL